MSLRRTLDKQRNVANVPHRGRNRDGTFAFSRTPTALSEVSYPCPERSLLQAPERPHGAAGGSSRPVRRRNTGTDRPTMGCVAMGRTNPTQARLACRDRAQAAAHTRSARNASVYTQNAAPGLWRSGLHNQCIDAGAAPSAGAFTLIRMNTPPSSAETAAKAAPTTKAM
jgi:hypothetical protein